MTTSIDIRVYNIIYFNIKYNQIFLFIFVFFKKKFYFLYKKETDGTFGSSVLQNIIIPENIVIDYSRSGKVTKRNLKFFYEHILNKTTKGCR